MADQTTLTPAALAVKLVRQSIAPTGKLSAYSVRGRGELREQQLLATYVLVHGSWHGGWCWYRVAARLKRAGHRVITPDLLSLGCDTTPYRDVTLQGWTDQIARHVQSASEPVILAGHSRGGIVISEVAEKVPEQIRMLVYVSAFLLRSGQSLLEVAGSDSQSLVLPGLAFSEDRLSASIRPDVATAAFYGDCGEEDIALALSLLRPEPLAPSSTPVQISSDRFGHVPRMYIECSRDRAISPSVQTMMQAALPCQRRTVIDSDHSPFISRPDELARTLLLLAQ
jgi:pimeloyl-ACP methyl ester carboxylesterase